MRERATCLIVVNISIIKMGYYETLILLLMEVSVRFYGAYVAPLMFYIKQQSHGVLHTIQGNNLDISHHIKSR